MFYGLGSVNHAHCITTCCPASPFVFHRREKIIQGWINTSVFLGELFVCVCNAWCQSAPTREICLDSRVGLMTEMTEICMFTKLISELNEPKQSLLSLGKHQYRVSSKDVLFHFCVYYRPFLHRTPWNCLSIKSNFWDLCPLEPTNSLRPNTILMLRWS